MKSREARRLAWVCLEVRERESMSLGPGREVITATMLMRDG